MDYYYHYYYVSSYPEPCPRTYTAACLIDNLTPFKRFLVCKLTISLALENTHLELYHHVPKVIA